MSSYYWIKLDRNVLNDEKISFIMRRYGHECLTFWMAMLTKSENGVLLMDEDIFADQCLLETKRYEEIRDVFIKRGLVSVDDEGRLCVIKWDEYQVGESTERVRRYREKGKNIDETLQKRECNVTETPMERDETKVERTELELELELELDKEGEERASATPTPADYVQDEEGTEANPPIGCFDPVQGDGKATPAMVVQDWFSALSVFGNIQATPPPKAESLAIAVVAVAGGSFAKARRFREEYFASWRELWFATSRSDKGKPERDRLPDFDFQRYCANIPAIAARIAAKKPEPAKPRQPTAPPPTPEERAEAAQALSKAMASAGYKQAMIA